MMDKTLLEMDAANQRSALVIVGKEPFTITIRAAIQATNFDAHTSSL